jgi:hypothetical protein
LPSKTKPSRSRHGEAHGERHRRLAEDVERVERSAKDGGDVPAGGREVRDRGGAQPVEEHAQLALRRGAADALGDVFGFAHAPR